MAYNFKLDKSVGVTPGLQIWRVDRENGTCEPKEETDKEYTALKSENSYIILYTKDQEQAKGKWQIHIWYGEGVKTEEYEGTKDLAKILYDRLDRRPILYRERQNRESALFLKYYNITREENEAIQPEIIEIEISRTKRAIIVFITETINILLIFVTFAALHMDKIRESIPNVPYIYQSLPILYEYVPEKDQFDLIIVASSCLCLGFQVVNGVEKICTKSKSCLMGYIIKQMITFILNVYCAYLIDNGQKQSFAYITYKTVNIENIVYVSCGLWFAILCINRIGGCGKKPIDDKPKGEQKEHGVSDIKED